MAVKRYATKFNLLQELDWADERIKDLGTIMGVSGTTQATMTSAQRVSMYNKHVSQHMTLNNPDFPRIFTGTENLYGDMSSYYHKIPNRTKVLKIVRKFRTNQVAVLFVQDLVTGKYDYIERVEAKPFTEVFGFGFNNQILDTIEENEILEPNRIISSSTGYDEYNNHCIGVNALTLFSFHPNLTEDAAMISSRFADRVSFNKIHTIEIKIPQDNMIPLNVHGDKDHYKILPDIGENCNHVLAALRHIAITQMADLSNDQLRQVNMLQDSVYIAKGEVIDMDIYTNNPIPDGLVYAQLRDYYEQQRVYYKSIYEFCQKIKGQKCTKRLQTLFALARDHVNEDAVWLKNSVIRSINIVITTKERVKMVAGQKLTG